MKIITICFTDEKVCQPTRIVVGKYHSATRIFNNLIQMCNKYNYKTNPILLGNTIELRMDPEDVVMMKLSGNDDKIILRVKHG